MSTRTKLFNTTVSLFCTAVLLLLILLPSGVAAAGTDEVLRLNATAQATAVTDTTAMTQREYQQSMQEISAEMTVVEAIQPTCEWFISSVYASRRSGSYDCTAFAADAPSLDATLAYLASACEYQRLISEAFDLNIVSDKITFDNFHATVTGNTCIAEIGVHYSYELTGRFDETCYLNCMYYLQLEYDNGWKIVSATTSMPGEQSEDFVYAAFDAQATVQALIESEAEAQRSPAEELEQEAYVARAGMTRTFYSVVAAVDYAKLYYNKTNSLFGAESANCQNFASQCVWAGLLSGCNAAGNSITAIPAVSTALVSSGARNVWCKGQVSTYYDPKDPVEYKFNYSWVNVNGFLNLIMRNNYAEVGPQGTYRLGLRYASAGDVIAWDTSGDCVLADGDFDHAMFVTKVTGTSGSRGMADIFIAANTNETTSAYMPLTTYNVNNLTASDFATADITDGYYLITDAEINTTADSAARGVSQHVWTRGDLYDIA